MKLYLFVLLSLIAILSQLFCETQALALLFKKELKRPWKLAFEHKNSTPWQENWFLDGENALVTSKSNFFEINTQDRESLSRIYAVLWTKESFQGDIKIEYDFKKEDQHNKGVNIIYIQATGDEENGNSKDIQAWSKKRKSAAMSDYFLNMHTYHMSYAAYGNKPDIEYKDYIRGRRYLPLANKGLKNTVLEGEYDDTQLFEDREWVHVTIIKTAKEFLVEFKHPRKTQLCRFSNEDKPGIHAGRIGLRLMPNRVSHFKNFKVSTLEGVK